MYVQPIIDLWTMKPFAYALVDAQGKLYKAATPHELYEHINLAYFREMTPLVVFKLDNMQGDAWQAFVKDFPDMDILLYEDGKVYEQSEKVILQDSEPVQTQWIRGISDIKQLDEVKRMQVRYGSGSILVEPYELQPKGRRKQPRIKWA